MLICFQQWKQAMLFSRFAFKFLLFSPVLFRVFRGKNELNIVDSILNGTNDTPRILGTFNLG